MSSGGALNVNGLSAQHSVNRTASNMNNNAQQHQNNNTISASTSQVGASHQPQMPYAKLPIGGVVVSRAVRFYFILF